MATKMPWPIRPSAVAALREQLRGRLVSPDDTRYDAARKVWNGRIDRRPFLVAFCADEKEVVVALRFAREHELLVAVRGGGHSCAGTAVCDDGFVIDLSLMKAIEVDAAGRSAQAQGGVLWGELDRATQTFGLAVPGGTDSEVGIAGLTLGGGNGWLMGVHGATCDNLLSADVVMAPRPLSEKTTSTSLWPNARTLISTVPCLSSGNACVTEFRNRLVN